MPISWGVPPPAKATRGDIGLLAVNPGEVVLMRCLGPLTGLETHWVNRRTVACLGEADCRVHNYPVTWKGFMAVESHGRSWRGKAPGYHRAVLVVTEEIGEAAQVLRVGTLFAVQRAGKASNSPLSLSDEGIPKKPLVLPEAFDVRPYVLRAMGMVHVSVAKLRLA